MEYRVLGPIEVLGGDGPLPLGGAKQRALLALLLLNANRVVSRDQLIDQLWGDDPPETAVTNVQVYVSRLRKLLPEGTLVTRPPGYMIVADPESLDLHRFERLVAEARRSEPGHASDLLRQALGLWRGEALAEFAGDPFALIEIRRLDALRAAALEERIEVDLALGQDVELIGELEVLIAAHPHRERLRKQLMTALYRAGRQAEALDEYLRVRELLDEQGVEPDASLQRLQRQILNHDEELDAPARLQTPEPAPRREPRNVTVLFAVLATTNEAQQDLVQTEALLERLHVEAAAEIDDAGGQLEKGFGNAFLATFGPTAEGADDHAVRAARVACAIRDRLSRAFAETLLLRMALESGDVILGGDRNPPIGAPVTMATGLVARARPGDLLVGDRAVPAVDAAFRLEERAGAHVLVGPRRTTVVRKVVTVLFADLVDSTRLGEQLDPEAHWELMRRYFEQVRAAVERHGGTVEKFIGDAVMAVFGVPVVHEDDALRAVRAATEMRDSLAGLNDDLGQRWGLRLRGRIGVNTGEVIADDRRQGDLIVTGMPVTIAERLEGAAAPGEILISEATHQLVRDAVVAERLSDRAVKGGRTVEALRLVDLRPGARGHTRRFDSPLVDREQELHWLREAFATVVQDQSCHLRTVLGDAGIGKSRLVQEFVGEVAAEGLVVVGRCLSYGEGITYWPLAEVVQALLRSEAAAEAAPPAAFAAMVAAEEKADVIADLISAALGLSETEVGNAEETFWAVRKLFEAVAHRRPLVVVFDDLQWAEPTFIEFVNHVADFSRGAPILLLCMARPELFDSYPGWGGGKVNVASTLLKPLNDGDSRQLIANLVSGESLPAEVETRIVDAAGGNAFFVEEMLAAVVDDDPTGPDEHRRVVEDVRGRLIPQTIELLLTARLEGLPDDERDLLKRASVEGSLFHRSAIRELAFDSSDAYVESNLASLLRRDLIRPERSTFAGDEAYSFRHILIRDAAYDSLAKTDRADLHERVAAWLERAADSRLREYEEIVGYHLEQAYLCRIDIGWQRVELSRLGARASDRLESAGRRALARGDLPAAIGLLNRAEALAAGNDARRAALLPAIGAALVDAGELETAEKVLAQALEVATAARDEGAASRVRLQQQALQLEGANGDIEEAERTVARVVPIFERSNDHDGLCRAWRLQASVHWNQAHAVAAADAWERAATHARLAGEERAWADNHTWTASAIWFGPTPVVEGISRCEEIIADVRGNLEFEALTVRHLAGLHAMNGDFELARALIADSKAAFEGRPLTLNSASSHNEAVIELLAGDAAAAERSLRAGFDALQRMGGWAFVSTTAAFLAAAVLAQGRDAEAERLVRQSAELAAPIDALTQVLWRSVHARILARRRLLPEAEAAAREAVSRAEHIDFLVHRGDAFVDLAHVLRAAGREQEAAAFAAEGLHCHVQKGNVVTAARIRSELGVLV